jgi:hypothetical protein
MALLPGILASNLGRLLRNLRIMRNFLPQKTVRHLHKPTAADGATRLIFGVRWQFTMYRTDNPPLEGDCHVRLWPMAAHP